jgi:hypothetical protein
MAFTLVQAGTKLYSVNADGGHAELTLPTGITLSDQRVPRFARFKRYAILVNTPSRPIIVATDGTVYPLSLLPPANALVLSNQNGGHLTGTYNSKYTFRILDASGNVVTESDYSPLSNDFTVTDDFLLATNVAVSGDSITDRRTYRTATNGTEYFSWYTLDGNVNTSFADDTPDASLGILSAPVLGSAPDLTLIVEWHGRLWGVDRSVIDNVRWTESGTAYAWSALNTLPIQHIGQDSYGITAFIPRRNALGVGRATGLYQITGNSLANIKADTVKEEIGVLTQESVVVYRDQAYFLWRDGVYRWDDNGVVCVSDLGGVRSWFATDQYFNRAMFARAFATYDVEDGMYTLFLASKGSNTIDRWVKMDFDSNVWWGPHKTDAFRPTSAFLVRGANGHPFDMIGSSNGILSLQTTDKNDWDAVPIDMEIIGRDHDGKLPDLEKVWLQMSINGKVQPKGIVKVTPATGDPDSVVEGDPMEWDMSVGRQRLDRLGFGQVARLKFNHKTLNEDVLIYGYEIPYVVRGRR